MLAKTHFADVEIRRIDQGGILVIPLPPPVVPGHQWVCNHSLDGWPYVLALWEQLQLPRIYLCESQANEMHFVW